MARPETSACGKGQFVPPTFFDLMSACNCALEKPAVCESVHDARQIKAMLPPQMACSVQVFRTHRTQKFLLCIRIDSRKPVARKDRRRMAPTYCARRFLCASIYERNTAFMRVK